MNKLIIFVLMVTSFSCQAVISSGLETNKLQFVPAPNQKEQDGFYGLIVVTPSNEWEKEWNTSTDTIPHFNEVTKASLGQELSVLTLFANPKPDSKNNVNVVCSIRVTRPNKTIAVNERNISCLNGQLQGAATNIRLSPGVLKFIAEKSDPYGTWLVDVTIEDKNRKTKLELKTQYEFIGEGG